MERIRTLLCDEGLQAGVRYLNQQASHRFTAVYYFDGPMLRNLVLVDKQDPSVHRCPDLPVLDSYCMYVRRAVETFRVDHAAEDARVAGHPKQRVVQSYCGIPLVGSDGRLHGTLCHFDYDSKPFTPTETELLERVAPLFAEMISRIPVESIDRAA